jgi:hypothetical protein
MSSCFSLLGINIGIDSLELLDSRGIRYRKLLSSQNEDKDVLPFYPFLMSIQTNLVKIHDY